MLVLTVFLSLQLCAYGRTHLFIFDTKKPLQFSLPAKARFKPDEMISSATVASDLE